MITLAYLVSELIGTDEQTSIEILIIIFTVIVGFLIFYAFFAFLKSGRKNAVYLLGVSDAGKSTLFARLITKGQTRPLTVTSQTVNVFDGYSTPKGTIFRLIDVPGADKIRSNALMTSLIRYPAAAVMFVVDSCTTARDSREPAEWLYTVLAEAFGSAASPPLLVVCAKQDAPGAKSARAVRAALEREFGTLHRTRRAAPVGVDGGNKQLLAAAAVDADGTFDFDRLPRGCTFVEYAAHATADGVDDTQKATVAEIEKWLDDLH